MINPWTALFDVALENVEVMKRENRMLRTENKELRGHLENLLSVTDALKARIADLEIRYKSERGRVKKLSKRTK